MAKLIGWTIMLLTLTGCASVPQMQSAIDEIDQFWGQSNRKILADKGSQVLPYSIERMRSIVKESSIRLGFKDITPNLASNSLTFKAQSPTPFSEAEYKQIRIVEEPIMQAMAATHVGGFTSSFFALTSNDTYTVMYVRLEPVDDYSTKVTLSFDLEWIKGRKQSGMILGTQPPPESVRMGIDKFWRAIKV